jgi:transcriptional regulator with XRE-family HTH domain
MKALFLHKAIRAFRLKQNWKQKELTKRMGISTELMSDFELGISFPGPKYMERINALGANIRPSFLSPLVQKICRTIRRKINLLKRSDPAFLEGVFISKRERLWIQEQMLKKNLRHKDVAEKAGCSRANVTSAMRGQVRSARVQRAVAELLGYPSFEAMIAAARGKGEV